MTAPREAVLRKVREWVAIAEEDRRMAQQGAGMIDPPYRLVAFHSQQCAEKYLKAFLVLQGVDFPYTHNISVLLEVCRPLAEWAQGLSEAGRLSDYAVTARYPGVGEEVTQAEAVMALELADRVRLVVRRAIEELGGQVS